MFFIERNLQDKERKKTKMKEVEPENSNKITRSDLISLKKNTTKNV
jgi:hypothetical protein